jgi:subtilisin-like proprotein convertase family protein
MPKSEQHYSQDAHAFTLSLKPDIERVASQLNLRPEVIFGALVEENHDFLAAPDKNALGDNLVKFRNLNHLHLMEGFIRADLANKIDNHNSLDKFANTVLNDIGPFNIKIATAIRLLQQYQQNTPADQDPLQIRQYQHNYPLLVTHLMNGQAAPAIAGLLLLEADRYMQNHTAPSDWQGLRDAKKDALLITYYNMGPVRIERKRIENIQRNQGRYAPKPGMDEAAGVNHEFNAAAIGQVFGHSDYASHITAPPVISNPSSSTLSPSASSSSTLPATNPTLPQPRPASIQLVEYHDAHSVRLKSGGSLSDIVAIERSRGNPISVADLRAVNGLSHGMERKLTLDQPLLVPQRQQQRLLLDIGQVKLDFNPQDGSYQYTIKDPANQTTVIHSRSLDPSSGMFSDRYAEIDTENGVVRRETIQPVEGSHVEYYRSAIQLAPIIGDLGLPEHPAWSGLVFDHNHAAAPIGTPLTANQFYSDAQFHSLATIAALNGVSLEALEAANAGLSRAMSLLPGTRVTLPAVKPLFELSTTPNPQPSWHHPGERQVAQDVRAGFVSKDATKSIFFNNGALDASDFARVQMASMATGGVRPGNVQADDTVRPGVFLGQYRFSQATDNPLNQALTLNTLATQVHQQTYVDPLVLDLSGQGVGLTNDVDDGVLFDVDHSGRVKQTGWIDREAGLLVKDDGSGHISNASQLFSEYYGGRRNSDGQAGSQPFTDGFAALASEDHNRDQIIDSQDTIWSSLRVWVDGNHNARTDSGELKTLDTLGISQFSLRQTPSNQRRAGNLIRATGHFTRNGQQQALLSVDFSGNPVGHAISTQEHHHKIHSSVAGRQFIAYKSLLATGETLDATTLGVDNLLGNRGDDVLIAAANGSWLVGGPGSNRYVGGDGNDVLVISATDQQQNISGGGGLNTAIITGSAGVTLNLAQAQIQIAHGGEGDDVLISGGHGNAFIKGGNGHSTLIGGGGQDVLVGGQGRNTIYGGSGKALIYAGPKQNEIHAAAGGSIIYAGGGNSQVFGAAGDDIVVIGHGALEADGGGGTNLAEFSGSYADYQIQRQGDIVIVSDRLANRDGNAKLRNIQKLNFANIKAVDLSLGNPLPVPDILTQDTAGQAIDRTRPLRFAAAQLLANDQGLAAQGQLHISEVGEAVGGTVALAQDGEIAFSPDPRFAGLMRFKYSVADRHGHRAATVQDLSSGKSSTMRATVSLLTPELPNDPLLNQAWYLTDSNIVPVWRDYTGKGIRIGQFEPGSAFSVGPEILDQGHPDLIPNLDPAWLASGNLPQVFSNHATMVAGVMVAAKNGSGSIGVAYDAKLSGYYLSNDGQDLTALGRMAAVDIANHSWSFKNRFSTSLDNSGLYTCYQYAAEYGRRKLGTVMVTAGGNQREEGGSAQDSPTNNNRFSIQVGAINAQEDLSTLSISQMPFSNPGASLLLSAPGSNVISSSQAVQTARGSTFGSHYSAMNGTSFATPIVSGVAALMLEANPDLGYRDVQHILALSARKIDDPQTDWRDNHARHWNGGSLHASHDYGFGMLDARAALRLAETWVGQRTGENLASRQAKGIGINLQAAPGSTASTSLRLADGVRVEHVEVEIDASFARLGDLSLKLISPSGTESILLDRPGKAPTSPASDGGDSRSGSLRYTLMSTHNWGESSAGEWRLQLGSSGQAATLKHWAINAYGAPLNADDQYIYTDEFPVLGQGPRAVLDDRVNGTPGGHNTLNAAAMRGDCLINLKTGQVSLGGTALSLPKPEQLHAVFSGDGNDTLVAHQNGSLLDGGRGHNSLQGGAGKDLFVVRRRDDGLDTVLNFDPAHGDQLQLLGFAETQFSELRLSQEGENVRVTLPRTQAILLKNQTLTQITDAQFSFTARLSAQAFNHSSNLDSNISVPIDTAGVFYLDGVTNGFTMDQHGVKFTGITYHGDSTPNRFVVRKLGAGNFSNILMGFKDGVDKIDVRGLDISDFSSLGLSKVTLNEVRGCSVYNKSIRDWRQPKNLVFLSGIDHSQLDASDFIFAPPPSARKIRSALHDPAPRPIGDTLSSTRQAAHLLIQALGQFASSGSNEMGLTPHTLASTGLPWATEHNFSPQPPSLSALA